jgi:hypothetical protein
VTNTVSSFCFHVKRTGSSGCARAVVSASAEAGAESAMWAILQAFEACERKGVAPAGGAALTLHEPV